VSYLHDDSEGLVAKSCDDCFSLKRVRYTACQAIPPADQPERRGCFDSADRELSTCKQQFKCDGALKTALLVGAGVVLASKLFG